MDINHVQSNLPLDLKSPIFKPRPGWGGKLANWLRKHFESRVLPVLAVVLILVGAYLNFSDRDTDIADVKIENKNVADENENIKKKVQPGQGLTHVIRSILADFLENNKLNISIEQKLYVESYLVSQHSNKQLKVGDMIAIDIATLKAVIGQAQNLNEYQLKAWSRYVK